MTILPAPRVSVFMRSSVKAKLLAILALLAFSCASSEKLEIPAELPEICRGIDFVSQPDMREVCGVRPLRFQSYKNIPQQRYMIMPKGASLVKTKEVIELRLPNLTPITMPSDLAKQLDFSPDSRLVYIKNTMLYKEIFPPGQERIKMFKLDIPTITGTMYPVCFLVPNKAQTSDSRNKSILGQSIEVLDCNEFQQIASKYSK